MKTWALYLILQLGGEDVAIQLASGLTKQECFSVLVENMELAEAKVLGCNNEPAPSNRKAALEPGEYVL